jgi:hypothetical protein
MINCLATYEIGLPILFNTFILKKLRVLLSFPWFGVSLQSQTNI